MHNEAGDLLRSSTEKAKSEFDAMVNEFTNLKLTKAKAMEEKVSIIKSQEENVSALLSSMFFLPGNVWGMNDSKTRGVTYCLGNDL